VLTFAIERRRHRNTIFEDGQIIEATPDRHPCSACPGTVGVATLEQSLLMTKSVVKHRVPFLYEEAYQWYTSFDDLGETITRPNPTPALQFLSKVINHLTQDCAWPISRVHFFGFAQGGSVVAEFGLEWWRTQLKARRLITQGAAESEKKVDEGQPSNETIQSFGSIVTISGPLLSYPTLSTPCQTPMLVVHRSPPAETALPADAVNVFKKAYQSVVESKLGAKPAGMPGSKQEWEPIMRFWSQHLSKRQMEGLYEIMSGLSSS